MSPENPRHNREASKGHKEGCMSLAEIKFGQKFVLCKTIPTTLTETTYYVALGNPEKNRDTLEVSALEINDYYGGVDLVSVTLPKQGYEERKINEGSIIYSYIRYPKEDELMLYETLLKGSLFSACALFIGKFTDFPFKVLKQIQGK